MELAKSYMVEQMKVYGPPSPPPPLSTENSSSPTLSTIPENHLYIHPMDYDPPQFLDSMFEEYTELFDWTKALAESRSTIKLSNEKTVDRKRKRSDSTSNENGAPEKKKARRETSTSRKKIKQSGDKNLFNYKSSTTTRKTTQRSRKRTQDENTIVTIPFTTQEDEIICKYYEFIGPNWRLISSILNSFHYSNAERTYNQISYHYIHNLSPNKPPPKKSRKNAPATPQPEIEYSSKPFELKPQLISLLTHVAKIQKTKYESSSTRQEPHKSHHDVASKLTIIPNMKPIDVIKLQNERKLAAQQTFAPRNFTGFTQLRDPASTPNTFPTAVPINVNTSLVPRPPPQIPTSKYYN